MKTKPTKAMRWWTIEVAPDPTSYLDSYELFAENFSEVEEMLSGRGVDVSGILNVESCPFEDSGLSINTDGPMWLDYVSYKLAKESPDASLPR